MSFSFTFVNMLKKEYYEKPLKLYQPILNICIVIVIVNLGMLLDYRLIAGSGLFKFIYIISCMVRKIGFSYLGGLITKANKNVTRFSGFILLTHSGFSLIFTRIAAITLYSIDP